VQTPPPPGYYWQQPPRQSHTARNWLIGLSIGCGSLILLGTVGLVGLIWVGSKLATSIPTPAQASFNCQPKPCAAFDGLTLLISNIDRDYQPKDVPSYEQRNASPRPGFHFVRLEVTFTVQSGEHEIDPLDTVQLKDSLGFQQTGLALDLVDPHCLAPTGATVAAGSKYGPVPLCFEAGGSTTGPLKLVWIPSGLTGPQPGVEITLP
jgi:hypothetical protein